jgi:hypothetical protein
MISTTGITWKSSLVLEVSNGMLCIENRLVDEPLFRINFDVILSCIPGVAPLYNIYKKIVFRLKKNFPYKLTFTNKLFL